MKTTNDTCLACPASLVCATREVTRTRCSDCKKYKVAVDGSNCEIIVPSVKATMCHHKFDGQHEWVCESCLEKRKQIQFDNTTRRKLRNINLDDGYSGEDEW